MEEKTINSGENENDPFFKPGEESRWNAFIGAQGQEINYVDGYIDGAIILVDTVLKGESGRQRDTLILPILYTVRV